MINCPVCPKRDIPPETLTCPNCGVDLRPIRRLLELSTQRFNEGLSALKKGDPIQALQKLMSALDLDARSVHVRLLIGKIFWEMGRHDDAVAQWREVLEVESGNLEADRLIRVAREDMRRKQWRETAIKIGGIGVVLFAFVFIGASHLFYRTTHTYSNAEVVGLQREITGLRRIAEELKAAEKKEGIVPDGLGNLLQVLSYQEGIRAELKGTSITVSFFDGLFLSGSDRLMPRSYGLLKRIAEIFDRQDQPYQISVEGVTDNIPHKPGSRWGDNWNLGLARACAALWFLSQQIPATQMTWAATSSGASNSPFPNDTSENRSKNRTVMIHVSLNSESNGK